MIISTRPQDVFMTALCAWREARNQLSDGMGAVAWVIRNRCAKKNSSPYAIVVAPAQFSSITSPGDPQLNLYPTESDSRWIDAQGIASAILNAPDSSHDGTNGATLYYNPDAIEKGKTYTTRSGMVIPWPKTWNPAVVEETITIGSRPNMHIFFREK